MVPIEQPASFLHSGLSIISILIQEEGLQGEASGEEHCEDEEAHENGTEETAEVDDEHDTKALDGELVNAADNKTPEPPVSFDSEPADKVATPQNRNF